MLGSGDNWQSFARNLSENTFSVYLVDLRNHGHSPHADEHNYKVMSEDVLELINDNQLKNVILLGHSMGGKVAMLFATTYPEMVEKLIVADIGPKYYAPHHQDIFEQ